MAEKMYLDPIIDRNLRKIRTDIRFDGHRILLAEDNELNREIACELLESRGMTVETAKDGEEAFFGILYCQGFFWQLCFT